MTWGGVIAWLVPGNPVKKSIAFRFTLVLQLVIARLAPGNPEEQAASPSFLYYMSSDLSVIFLSNKGVFLMKCISSYWH